MIKICTKCLQEKPSSEFYNRRSKKSNKNSHCKECEHEQIKEWRNKNKEANALINRKARLKRVYGITLEQYEEMLKKQNYCCAICERHQDEFKTKLAIDHNHVTKEIRGLLCTYCNHKIVGRHRDGAKLRKVADYIEQGMGWFVPDKKKKSRIKN